MRLNEEISGSQAYDCQFLYFNFGRYFCLFVIIFNLNSFNNQNGYRIIIVFKKKKKYDIAFETELLSFAECSYQLLNYFP